ncbi:hypothetical protein [Massilia sp. Se16.2.3]|uniref:hypothetical protein n=1 Tax=Massilia sp. Se16.2.3 TaxID=2709303 RepID=UPI0015FFE3C8|nr:hypothetical protein [Massilia sp. Se16.2.3]QNB00529.1 hypothetical protein G4G31_19795 [Massilia sp. Se16.2.3]
MRRCAVDPDGPPPYRRGAREIRLWLRGSEGERLGSVTSGSYSWSNVAAPEAAGAV